jgi:hypothetical protein
MKNALNTKREKIPLFSSIIKENKRYDGKRTMKTLRIAALLALAALSTGAFAEKPEEAWRKVSENRDRTVWINTKDVEEASPGLFKYHLRFKRHSSPGHALASQEMDCEEKRYRELSLSLFDEGGARLQTVRKVGPWEEIKPGTNGEKIYKVVCE